MRLAVAAAMLFSIAGCGPGRADPKHSPAVELAAQTIVAGVLKATTAVGTNGDATVRIHIEVPPGTRGMQPQLGLRYSSHASNGEVGVGWRINGLSAITRCPALYDTDVDPSQPFVRGSINYDENDRFCIDGQRMIVVSGTYGEPGSVYRTELETWREIVADDVGPCGKGPCSFEVKTRDGQTWTYGTGSAAVMAGDAQNVRVWALSQIEDLNGNGLQVSYAEDPAGIGETGGYYPQSIVYTTNPGAAECVAEPSSCGNRSVTFAYEPRPDSVTTFQGGYPVTTGARLTDVLTTVAGTPVFDYHLDYLPGVSARTNQSLLASVSQCAGADATGPCLTPTSFAWQGDEAPAYVATPLGVTFTSTDDMQIIPGDVNGDGQGDLIYIYESGGSLYALPMLWDGSDFKSCPNANTNAIPIADGVPMDPADVNGDGRLDLVQYWQYSDGTARVSTWLSASDGCSFGAGWDTDPQGAWPLDQTWPADINGDGRTDLVLAWDEGGSYTTAPLLSEGTAFSAGTGGTIAEGLGTWPMDVNADGMVDLVTVWSQSGSLSATAYRATGTGFDSGTDTHDLGGDSVLSWLQLDLNGDGNTDLVQTYACTNGNRCLRPVLSNGVGGFEVGAEFDTQAGSPDSLGLWAFDLTGSGYADVVQAWNDGGSVSLSAYGNDGDGFVAPIQVATLTNQVPGSTLYPLDVAGDGQVDLVQVWPDGQTLNTTLLAAAGGASNRIESVTDGQGGQFGFTYKPMSDPTVYTPRQAAPSSSDGEFVVDARGYNPVRTPMNYPVQNVAGGTLQLVATRTETNAQAASLYPYAYQWTYAYSNASLDMRGRGWQGFETRSERNDQTGRTRVSTYGQAFPMTGTLVGVEVRCDATVPDPDPLCPAGVSDTVLRRSTTTFSPETFLSGNATPNPPIYQVVKTQVQFDDYTYGSYDFSRVRTYSYDPAGNGQILVVADLGLASIEGVDQSTDDDVYRCRDYADVSAISAVAGDFVQAVKITSDGPDGSCTRFDGQSYDSTTDYSLQILSYASDSSWNLQTDSVWDDANDVALTTSYLYDSFGNRKSVTEPGDRVTTYDYDDQTHTFVASQQQTPLPGGPTLTTASGWDARFGLKVAGSRFTDQDPTAAPFTLCTDEFGRVVAAQTALPPVPTEPSTNCVTPVVTGGTAQFITATVVTTHTVSRDDAVDYTVTIDELQDWDGTTMWSTRTTDGLGRGVRTVHQGDPVGGDVAVCSRFDSEGRVVGRSFPYLFTSTDVCSDGNTARFWSTQQYDVYGRLTSNVVPHGPTGSDTITTHNSYASTLQAQVITASGTPDELTRKFTYAFYNGTRKANTMELVQDGNATTHFTYDRVGRLLTATDPPTKDNPSGVTDTIIYDSLARRTSIASPDLNTVDTDAVAVAFTYDPVTGELETTTDAAGNTITFAFDGVGRMLTQTWDDGYVITFGYDDPEVPNSAGQLTSVTGGPSTGASDYAYTYAYDALGNRNGTVLTLGETSDSYKTSSTFDPVGRQLTLTWPSQETLTRVYSNRTLHTLSTEERLYATYSDYTAFGSPQKVKFGNGARATATYAPTGPLVGSTVTDANGSPLLDGTVAWTSLMRVDSVTDNLSPGGTDYSQQFGYTAGRLTSAEAPGIYGSVSYGYDASGNLTSIGDTTYTYEAHRVVSGANGATSTLSPHYDARGNMKSETVTGTAYGFDARNHLTSVSTPAGDPVLGFPVYDHNGKRLIAQNNTDEATSLFVGPQYQVVNYADGSSQATHFIDNAAVFTTTLAGSGDGGGTEGYPTVGSTWLHTDYQGSTSLTTDDRGLLHARYAYYPYGTPAVPGTTGPADVPNTWHGKPYDSGSSLYYYSSRYYAPSFGRFLSPDTQLAADLFRVDALNRYAFALNNPVTFEDPTGHSVADQVVGSLLAALQIIVGIVVDVLSDGALESVGGSLIGAGLDDLQYSVTHGKDFSWKQYAVQTGMDLAIGLVTGGIGELKSGLSAATTEISRAEMSSASDAATSRSLSDVGGDDLAAGSKMGGEGADAQASDAGCNSFAGSTPVHTATGLVPIAEIVRGQHVIGVGGSFPVTGHTGREVGSILRVELSTGEVIEVTHDHPLHTPRGWVAAADLVEGDPLSTREGHVVVRGTRQLRGSPSIDVHDLEVATDHRYYIGVAGILAHNGKGECPLQPVRRSKRKSRPPELLRDEQEQPASRARKRGRVGGAFQRDVRSKLAARQPGSTPGTVRCALPECADPEHPADWKFKSKNSGREITAWHIDHSRALWKDLDALRNRLGLTNEQFRPVNNDLQNLRLLCFKCNTSHIGEDPVDSKVYAKWLFRQHGYDPD